MEIIKMGEARRCVCKTLFVSVACSIGFLYAWSLLGESRSTTLHYIPVNLTQWHYQNTNTPIILDYTGYIDSEADYHVGNCIVTRNTSAIKTAHAVVITNRKLMKLGDLPSERYSWQRWVWLLDESPYHPMSGQPFTLAAFDNFFNWTMTYRKNSDVYAAYGQIHKKTETELASLENGTRPELVTAVISNCNNYYVHNRRFEYVKELNKTAKVTLFGKCGKMCQGHTYKQITELCPELKKFLFYLAFENANCKEYITEKLFGNGFEMGTVPVVMGATKQDYIDIAPPHSFIHVSDFKTPKELGEYLIYLSNNKTAYMEYHAWRKSYDTSYRIQYKHKSVWKPLCDKLLNDNGVPKTVKQVKSYWTLSDCDSRVPW